MTEYFSSLGYKGVEVCSLVLGYCCFVTKLCCRVGTLFWVCARLWFCTIVRCRFEVGGLSSLVCYL